MNLNKSLDFFDPSEVTHPVHIIGVGAIGSNLADMMVRLGVENIHIYDFDMVEPHNIANQRYNNRHLTLPKTVVMATEMKDINTTCNIIEHPEGWKPGMRLSGHIFLCVDNIDLRRQIVEENMYNPTVKSFHDFRMRLQDAQYYMADWSDQQDKDQFLAGMQFSHEEATAATPVSACGTTLNVGPTVWIIVANGVANFLNFIKEGKGSRKRTILIDAFTFNIIAM